MSVVRGRSQTERDLGNLCKVASMLPMHFPNVAVNAHPSDMEGMKQVQSLWEVTHFLSQELTSLRQDFASLGDRLVDLAEQLKARGEAEAAAAASAAGPATVQPPQAEVQSLLEVLERERQERMSGLAEHEAGIEAARDMVMQLDGKVEQQAMLVAQLFEEKTERAEPSKALPILDLGLENGAAVQDLGLLLETFQQQLHEEVAAVVQRSRAQHEDLKSLIVQALRGRASGAGILAESRASSEPLEELVARHVREAVPGEAALEAQIQECVRRALAEHSVPLQREVVLMPPLNVARLSTVAGCRSQVSEIEGSGQPSVERHLLIKTKATTVPVMDAAAALAAHAVSPSATAAVAECARSPLCRTRAPECITLTASDVSPIARVRILPQGFQQAAVVQRLVSGATTPKALGSSSRGTSAGSCGGGTSTRSWPSTAAAAPPPRVVGLATAPGPGALGSVTMAAGPPTNCLAAVAAASTPAGGSPVTARVASYAQRRRLATSCGVTPGQSPTAAPTAQSPRAAPLAAMLYASHSGLAGSYLRQCIANGKGRPASQEQPHRVRMRAA